MSVEGGPWAHIETPTPVSADDVNAATANAPYTLTPDGRYVSPDGRYCWSGSAWLPMTPAGYGESAATMTAGSGALPGVTDASPWGAPPTQTDSTGLAIASLVLGIFWLFGIGSVLAVIFGHISLSRIGRGEASGRGRAIAGLVLGYLGLALMVLAALGLAASSSHGATSSASGSSGTGGNGCALLLMRNAAAAEETHYVDTGAYTSNPDDLENDGFFSDQSVSILVHLTNDDYCLVGSNTQVTRGRVWYTYANGGIGTHASKADAEKACGDTNPSDYQVLSGDGS